MQNPEITFTHVLFLFQHKHVMIEKLLQFLVAKIDAQLLEAIEVKDFEACNVQHSDEANPKMKSWDHLRYSYRLFRDSSLIMVLYKKNNWKILYPNTDTF